MRVEGRGQPLALILGCLSPSTYLSLLLLLKIYLFMYIYVCGCFVSMYVQLHILRGHLYPMGLQLSTVVSHHVSAGN